MINLIPEFLVIKECLINDLAFKEACFKVRTSTSMSFSTSKEFPINSKDIFLHYFALEHHILNLFSDYKRNQFETLFLIVTLFHIKIKKDNFEKLKKSFLYNLEELKLKLDSSSFDILINSKVDNSLNKEDESYYSAIKRNLPLNIYQKITEEYDEAIVNMIVSNLQHEEVQLYAINNNFNIINSRLIEYKTFNGLKTYIGNLNPHVKFKRNKDILVLSYPIIYILKSIPFDKTIKDVLFSNLKEVSYANTLYKFLNSKNNTVSISSCILNPLLYRKAVNFALSKNMNFINSSVEEHKFDKKYDVVFTFGSSSLTDCKKDVSILVKYDNIDLEKEKNTSINSLSCASTLVKENSYLVFINKSILKINNEDVIDEFLKSNQDFHLVEQKILSSDDNLLTMEFLAVLKRGE